MNDEMVSVLRQRVTSPARGRGPPAVAAAWRVNLGITFHLLREDLPREALPQFIDHPGAELIDLTPRRAKVCGKVSEVVQCIGIRQVLIVLEHFSGSSGFRVLFLRACYWSDSPGEVG